MKTLRLLAIAVGFVVTAAPPCAAAQAPGSAKWADSARKLIDRSNQVGVSAIDDAIALLDRVLTVVPNDPVLLHYKGYALYRRTTTGPNLPPEEEVKTMLQEADRVLELSSKTLAWPETHALRASVFGQLIGLNPNPINAMRLGPKADNAMDKAIELGPKNPRVWLMRGIGSIFKPKLFGGGAEKAEVDIRKAIALLDGDTPEAPRPSWGRAESWAWLGQALDRQDKREDAKAAYRKALEIDPEFGWVKYQLLPELERRR
jgi:tetratricopeptide (TPR) repeat protein